MHALSASLIAASLAINVRGSDRVARSYRRTEERRLGKENPILRRERKWKGVGREGTVASEWETNHSEKFLVACRSVDARNFSFIRYNPFERERRRRRVNYRVFNGTFENESRKSRRGMEREQKKKKKRVKNELKGEKKKKKQLDGRDIKRERTRTTSPSRSKLLSANNYASNC